MTRLKKALAQRAKGSVLSDGEQEILALHDENERLRSALNVYAKPPNWISITNKENDCTCLGIKHLDIEYEPWKIAKEALGAQAMTDPAAPKWEEMPWESAWVDFVSILSLRFANESEGMKMPIKCLLIPESEAIQILTDRKRLAELESAAKALVDLDKKYCFYSEQISPDDDEAVLEAWDKLRKAVQK